MQGNSARRLLSGCWCCVVAIGVLYLASQAQAVTTSGSEFLTPGPGAAARLGDFLYIYGRLSDNRIYVRKTDGKTQPTWTNNVGALQNAPQTTDLYPAAATFWDDIGKPKFIAIAYANKPDLGNISVWRTPNGDTAITPWYAGIGSTSSAPAIGFCRAAPAAGQTVGKGYIVVAYREKVTGRLRLAWAPDTLVATDWQFMTNTRDTTTNVQTTLMSSGPTIVVDQAPGSTVTKLTIFYRIISMNSSLNNTIESLSTTDMVHWTLGKGDAFTQRSVSTPFDPVDPCVPSTVGTVIAEADPTSWATYHFSQMQVMRAGIMKFQMSYNPDWSGSATPNFYHCRYSDIQNCVTSGVTSIILRTAETAYSASQVALFMGTVKFQDKPTKSISNLPADFPGVKFIIEVGNEPDRNSATPDSARAKALEVAASVRPQYPNFTWIISMPTFNSSYGSSDSDYIAAFTAPNALGQTVMNAYDGIGVHSYADNSLAWNTTTESPNPLGVLYYCLARLPLGRSVFMTELGLNSRQLSWPFKAKHYRAAMNVAPSSVRGWTLFVASAHPQFNTHTHYCIDKQYTDRVITGVTAANGLTKITYDTVDLATPAWNVGDEVAIVNSQVLLPNGAIALDGNYNILGNPAPGVGFYWIPKDTSAAGAYNATTKPGRTDRYPLTTISGFPAGAAMGAR